MFIPLSVEHQQKISSSQWGSAIIAAIEAGGIVIENNNIGGWQVKGDPALAQAIIDNSKLWLSSCKKIKLDKLKEIYAEYFDHHKLADKAETFVHPTSLASHWSTAVSNYRRLKTEINTASDAKSVDAIDINTGWPVSL